MRKFILIILFLPFIVFWQSFQDVNPDRDDFVYIEDLLSNWIIDSWISFHPDNKITRAEFSKVVVLAFQWVANDKISNNYFPDVNSSSWYWPYVQSAKYFDLINGYPDWEFKPWNNIVRAEAIKIIVNASKIIRKSTWSEYTDNVTGQWFEPYANTAFAYWIYKWLLTVSWKPRMIFKWWDEITRWEMAIYLSRAAALVNY